MKRTFSRSTRSQDSFQSLDTLSSYNVCVADIFKGNSLVLHCTSPTAHKRWRHQRSSNSPQSLHAKLSLETEVACVAFWEETSLATSLFICVFYSLCLQEKYTTSRTYSGWYKLYYLDVNYVKHRIWSHREVWNQLKTVHFSYIFYTIGTSLNNYSPDKHTGSRF